MVYLVDVVVGMMKELSSSDPVMFQRDGGLYVVSQEGFAQVSFGLRIKGWDEKGEVPKIIEESTDVVKKRRGTDGLVESFVEGEGRYVLPLSLDKHSVDFSLEEMAQTAEKLAKSPDDGKIRIVNHIHSYKEGVYGADRTKVQLSVGRVMDRKRYLELLREKEDRLVAGIERLGEVEDRLDIHSVYQELKMPDCVIITPHLMVSLPRNGYLDTHAPAEVRAWDKETRWESRWDGWGKGSVLHYDEPRSHAESPYAVCLTTNTQQVQVATTGQFDGNSRMVTRELKRELDAIEKVMPAAEEYVFMMNEIHNRVCAKNIKVLRE